VGRGGAVIEETLGGGRLAKVVASAAEGSAFGVGGAFSHAQMSDDPLTAEAILHGAGLGALTGGGLSIGFQGLGELGKGIAKLRDGSEKALAQDSPALTNFSHTWEEMRDYHSTEVAPEQTRGFSKEEFGGVVKPQAEPADWSVSGENGTGTATGVPEHEVQDYARVPSAPAPAPEVDLATGNTRLLKPEEVPSGGWREVQDGEILKPGGEYRMDMGGKNYVRYPEPREAAGSGGKLADQDVMDLWHQAGGKTQPAKLAAAGEAGPAGVDQIGSEVPDMTVTTAKAWDAEGGKPGGIKGAEDRAQRVARAEEGARAWEAKLDRDRVPEYVPEPELRSQEPLPTPPGVTPEGSAPQAAPPPPDLKKTLTAIHGESIPKLPTTVKGLGSMDPKKAVKVGMTLNALGEHSADLEGRVQTLLSDLEKELGVATVATETPAQRWMALRRAAREASGTTGAGPRPRSLDDAPQADSRKRGYFARWRRRALGNLGDSAGRKAGGKGLIGKILGSGMREGGYVVASVLGGPKGLGLALGSKWLLKSKLAEVMMSVGRASPAHLAPLGRTAVWLKDRKSAAREILQLHAQADRVGDLVYNTIEGHGGVASAVTGVLVQRAQSVVRFLSSIAPRPGPGLDQLHWQPSIEKLLPVIQATEAIANPARGLARVLAGQAGNEAVQALWLAYPEHMTQAVGMLAQMQDSDLEKMTPARRQALSLFLKTPLGSWSPYSPGAAELRTRLFQTGPKANQALQNMARQKAQGQATNGRPAETTKLDRMLSGGRA
jgi:hypothetical protein